MAVVPGTLPGTPTAVTATTAAGGTARLTWSPPAADGGQPITGYRVSRDGTDADGRGAWSTVLGAGKRDFSFTRLVPGRAYTLTVSAVSAVGTGPAASMRVTAR
jgi:hypothetical protein